MRTLLVAGIGLLVLAASLTANEETENKREPSFWMKQKLTYSQGILNGLAKEDYELISQNAKAMKGLNQLEFFVRQRPAGYRAQLRTFQLSVDELVQDAEDENLDAATLAFTQMTISCVNCHKELRKN